MKISIIGAGNVGSTTALRLAQEGVGDILLVDIVKGLAQGKALDLEDARPILKFNYSIEGTDDIVNIKGSDIIVITAGLARKPGMTREELLAKNAAILKEVCLKIKESCPGSIVIVVTNPLDLMTYFALKVTGFSPDKLFGMGVSLDAGRFANLIGKELNVPCTDIDACVIGPHGEGMLPLSAFSSIKGVSLNKFVDEAKCEELARKTVYRGAEIVSLLGSGSAYYAPSAAVAAIVKAIVKDEKRNIGVSAYLNGEYGIKDVCIGVPCRMGRNGIEGIIELALSEKERSTLHSSCVSLKQLLSQLPL
ncbi:MAG: malate dehydrogenase [Candidatus Omnitrophica bacterium]|nr:malate dehydrogenase [Candidatus Omnitrophota bacterium]